MVTTSGVKGTSPASGSDARRHLAPQSPDERRAGRERWVRDVEEWPDEINPLAVYIEELYDPDA